MAPLTTPTTKKCRQAPLTSLQRGSPASHLQRRPRLRPRWWQRGGAGPAAAAATAMRAAGLLGCLGHREQSEKQTRKRWSARDCGGTVGWRGEGGQPIPGMAKVTGALVHKRGEKNLAGMVTIASLREVWGSSGGGATRGWCFHASGGAPPARGPSTRGAVALGVPPPLRDGPHGGGGSQRWPRRGRARRRPRRAGARGACHCAARRRWTRWRCRPPPSGAVRPRCGGGARSTAAATLWRPPPAGASPAGRRRALQPPLSRLPSARSSRLPARRERQAP